MCLTGEHSLDAQSHSQGMTLQSTIHEVCAMLSMSIQTHALLSVKYISIIV